MANVKKKKLRLALPTKPSTNLGTMLHNDSPKVAKNRVAETVYSPMTDLAMNMWELRTAGPGLEGTPKRRLSLSSAPGTPTPFRAKNKQIKPVALDRQLSFNSVCSLSPNMDSPMFADSPLLQERLGLMFQPKDQRKPDTKSPFQSTALARFSNLPVPFCGFDNSPVKTLDLEPQLSPEKFDREGSTSIQDRPPIIDDDENSRDSGVCFDSALKSAKEDLSFHFAEPHAPAPRRVRILSEDACSPLKYSPVKSSPLRSLNFGSLNFDTPNTKSPVLKQSSLTCTPEQDDGDDGFLDILDMDDHNECSPQLPSNFSSLLSGAMIEAKNESTPSKTSKSRRLQQLKENKPPKGLSSRRGLFRSPSVPARLSERCNSFNTLRNKRSEPDHPCEESPFTQVKRKRSNADISSDANLLKNISPCPIRPIQKAHSEAHIKDALNKMDQQQDLIADYSKTYCLPLTNGKHKDLKCITPETMGALQNGEYDHVIEKAIIVDCRYPYEFEGGHLKDALNIYTKDGIMDEFVKSDKYKNHVSSDNNSRTVLIFHCEFSSERGPKMSRFLREKDRLSNKECYPSLDFPEIYLLEGGYKAFYECHKELCVPQSYLPMLHENHSMDLKHFRAKSKSWGGEKGRNGRTSIRAGLKF